MAPALSFFNPPEWIEQPEQRKNDGPFTGQGGVAVAQRTTSNNKYSSFWYLLPGLVIYLAFYLIPSFQALYLSLFEWSGIGEKTFSGLQNYQRLFQDSVFLQSFANNLYFMAIYATIPVALGLVCAAILAQGRVKSLILFRGAYFLPQVVPAIAVGIIWRWIYHPTFGLINSCLSLIGRSNWQKAWLGDYSLVIHALAGIAVWLMFGYAMVIFLAGLQKVDKSYYEAAKVDGANLLVQFLKVTVPMLKNEITMVVILNLIAAMKILDLVFVTTKGGPGNASMVIGLYAYRIAFVQSNVGYGAAITTVMTIITVIIAWIVMIGGERSRGDERNQRNG